VDGGAIGLLQVDSAEVGAFTADDARVLEALGSQVAGSIESARRYEAVVELERLKSEFIERVSHELRTPITIMSGFVTTLQDLSTELGEQDRLHFIERIGHASTRLRYLIEEILTIRGLDSGMTEVVAMDVVVRDVVGRAARRVGGGEGVEADVRPEVHLRTDPAVLEQALEPLLDNAVKYGGGGRVTAARSGNVVRIGIEDAGPGIDPELRGRMFDRFVRGRHSIGGMGLGLAIARHHIASLHGEIVYTDLDPGSRFTVVVPELAERERPAAVREQTGFAE
jgi:signal transduction histidine kinase